MEYGKRDIIKQGKYYTRHVLAMTSEGLFSKSDIAGELAHRDIKIDELILLIQRATDRLSVALPKIRREGFRELMSDLRREI